MTPPQTPFEIPPIITYAVPGFVLLIIIEMIVVKLTKKGRYEYRDSATSLMMGLGNRVFGIMFGGLALLAYFAVYEFRLFNLGWTWSVMVACFFAEDLAYYWFHRIAHERRFFWASHIIHHSSQHYNLTTALRQTWTGALGLTFIFWLPLVYLGFPPLMVVMFSGISLVYQFWIHTELVGRMGPLEWVMNTPSHHRVHHATNPKYLDANYAGVLIIWDRLFGTFVREDDKEKPHYGIVSQLGTFNPLRVAFHEWLAIARDVAGAKKLSHVLGYVFGPPGWSPDGSRKTSASIKAEWAARQQTSPSAPAVAAE
ncbi:sterol desaturase family protein [Candidatus Viadribacter manganicus]|uniref:C-5 sterol desaturase n=1 Tax=Candidatus Viadribacter manganicus TaxID=1759059 RepID=A0A1B1ALK1_9PROT|nr:sterol desaturase family protein [Candidatus Viadribacter manganicus]ANP47459.1 C-5 sterol desaturase [Candidatus Viadribacter manganicus]